MRTFVIVNSEKRATCPQFIVSSIFFRREMRLCHNGFHGVDRAQSEILKSRFDKMLSRSMKAGLFEIVES